MQLSRRIAVVEPLPVPCPRQPKSREYPGSRVWGMVGTCGHGHHRGSSSLKVSLVAEGPRSCAASPTTPARRHHRMLAAFLEEAGAVDAVGHRIVHGGAAFTDAVVIDESTRRRSQRSPTSRRSTIRPARRRATAAGSPPTHPVAVSTPRSTHTAAAASTYAVPAEWRARWPIRRFGFHGSAPVVQSACGRAPRRPVEELSLVTAHIGAVRRCARSPPAARWTRRWGSRRSKAWSWPRVREALTPASCSGSCTPAGSIRRPSQCPGAALGPARLIRHR